MRAKMRLFLAALLLLALVFPLNLFANGQDEGEKTGTVNFWHGYPEFDVVWKEMAAQDYMVENPGVKVEISSFPLREFERKLAVAMPAGAGPDLYYFDLSFNVKFIEAGLVANPTAEVEAFIKKGYKVVSDGTDNHSMLIDLRTRVADITGKQVEKILEEADITVNKNMVPFDSRSPFQTSGIRVGTPAISTRGVKEELIPGIVDLMDRVIMNIDDKLLIEETRKEVNEMMVDYPMFV